MSDPAVRFHEAWQGMAQPVEGLVVAVPVLVEAQALRHLGPEAQHRLRELCPPVPPIPPPRSGELEPPRAIADLDAFLAEPLLLGLAPELFDRGEAVPEDLSYYAPEGRQTIRPTLALRRPGVVAEPPAAGGAAAGGAQTRPGLPPGPAARGSDSCAPSSLAPPPRVASTGSADGPPGFNDRYLLLVWEIPDGLALDRPEVVTGPWEYPPALKLDRLLRHARVPVGLLTNRRAVRLIYAPHGESTGALTFRIDDLAAAGGRPLLDAFVMLLSAFRLFGAAPERQLPALLEASRRRQADVTEALAGQVFEALEILLAGCEEAAGRGGRLGFEEAAGAPGDPLYGGLLTVLLRLVFLLYAEDRALLPVNEELYAEHLSVLGLFDQLQRDRALHPDAMALRFGAWDRLLALFRAVHEGAACGTFHLPPRRGRLFDPEVYPFLEGWVAGATPTAPEDRAALRTPAVDDGTVLQVLEKLVVLEGQRLSYRSLDVEQIGSVYEALMGFHVQRVYAPAVCLAGEQKKSRVWVTATELLAQAPARRARWLQEEMGLAKARAEKIARAVAEAGGGVGGEAEGEKAALAALEAFRAKGSSTVAAGRLVLQPGQERRRTSSHYTPRSLTEPIVERTLAPLLAAFGPEPTPEQLLALRLCDPAMGSGAFLVAACRHLAEHLVAAWTREGTLAVHAAEAGGDAIVAARRRVAQRCLYGVDKNSFAVDLAKLSLWLVTLARDLPFTFLDHALRHGDSLVGLSFAQIRGFHWQPEAQDVLSSRALDQALAEVIDLRQQIQELAEDPSPAAQRQKEYLLAEAEDAGRRARLLGDLVVGAFFAAGTARERNRELARRLTLVHTWLEDDGPPPDELLALQAELRERLPVFHWMLEFPEVFYTDRPDPLDGGRRGGAAWMDAFVGNPPFAGKNETASTGGPGYIDWLKEANDRAHGNSDLCSYFFRTTACLLGSSGTTGFLATKTIAEGDTRRTGLQFLVTTGLTIYRATRRLAWPGDASVTIAVVHLAKGRILENLHGAVLDEGAVSFINSRLEGRSERKEPVGLLSNGSTMFVGTYILGMGFTLTPADRQALIAADSGNASRIFPYVGGDELNSSPAQEFARYVINFGQRSLEAAEEWPQLLEIVRQRVKPERDLLGDNPDGRKRKKFWWQFGRITPALDQAMASTDRCLVASRHTKHLCFVYQSSGQIFAESMVVVPGAPFSLFANLQSRIHEHWALLLSSSMRADLRYSASDCFETFPFPQPDPRAIIPELEGVGERLCTARTRFMLDTQQGLTTTYNLLKDPACRAPRIAELRHLHEEMDRAVLAAYGWADIPVPPFEEPAGSRAREAFEDDVLDRLFLLNAERAAEEKKAAPSPGRGGKPGPGRRPGRPRKGGDGGQLKLGGLDGEE